MKLGTVIAVVRHNTELGGDLRLAVREFEALVGVAGSIVCSRDKLEALCPKMRVARIPELSKNEEAIALKWTGINVSAVNRLLRRSAFAQEVLIVHASSKAQKDFEKSCAAPFAHVNELGGNVTVALAWGYIIESEGVLNEPLLTGRVQKTVDLLLEPYFPGNESTTSRRVRKAKKTTLSLSHDLHIYKAKFFPRMVRALLNTFVGDGVFVVDPFCGSGTALLEASLLGLDSRGVDIDPICELIARTKVVPFLQSNQTLPVLDEFEAALKKGPKAPSWFIFPAELSKKLVRRDKIDNTAYGEEIERESALLAGALAAVKTRGIAADLLRVLASDAVTKKIRYRFIGVGNGKYTIELVKQPLLDRVREKVQRARELCYVFDELQTKFGFIFGNVEMATGDAKLAGTWGLNRKADVILTSPPYLPASSGREHYSASRALSFAVLGLEHGSIGYYNTGGTGIHSVFDVAEFGEANRLMDYLMSDASETANPQKDAMRFDRKAMPTRQYLGDIQAFFRAANSCLHNNGRLLLVVANQHTFYSHRRQELEHIVSGRNLYSEIAASAGLILDEEIKMELLKSSVSKARPRASEDYFESVLISRPSKTASKTAGRKQRIRSLKDPKAYAA
jgi:DNA methylase